MASAETAAVGRREPPQPEPTAEPSAGAAAVPSGRSRSRRSRRRERRETQRSRARPRRTHNQLVGLKLGASQIAAAQVVNKGGPRIVRMARMPLQRGVVVGGELREPEELASILKTFFKKNKLPRNCVRLGISNNRIGVRTFEITGIDDPKQLANAVRFRAQETLPIPLDEAVLDYRILEDRVGEDGVRVCRVLLVVAHQELVERYVAACRKAGLKLVGIDLEAFALLRALSDPDQPPGEDAAVVCVSIGHDRSTLAVSDGRSASSPACSPGAAPRWTPRSPASSTSPRPQSCPIKHALSLGEEGEAAGLDARHADEARRAMVGRAPVVRPRARRLAPLLPGAAEVPRHRRDPDHRRRGRLRRARRRARAADRHPRPRRRPARARQGAAYAAGTTAASDRLDGRRSRPGDRGLMRAVNLLPGETKQPRKRPTVVAQLALVAPFVVAGLLAAGFLLASSSVNSNRATLQALQDELASLPDARRARAAAEPGARLRATASGSPRSARRSRAASSGIASCARSRLCCRATSG